MAEEVQKTGHDQVQHHDVVVLHQEQQEEVVDVDVAPHVPNQVESKPTSITPAPVPPTVTVVEKEPPPVPETEEEEELPPRPKQVEEKNVASTDAAVSTKPVGGGDENIDEKNIPDDDHDQPPAAAAFKEETTKVADLQDSEKKALEELKKLVQDALNNHEFTLSPPPKITKEVEDNNAAVAVLQPVSQEEAPPASAQELVAKAEDASDVVEAVKVVEVPDAGDVNAVPQEKEKVVAPDAADDDGAKTVEAIEETIVAVSSAAAAQQDEDEDKHKQPEAKANEETNYKELKDASSSSVAEEVSIWGIPLLADERSDVILLKFLRARDFKVRDAFSMLKNTIRWRKEFGIDGLVDQDLGCHDLEKVVFMHGFDKDGHPVCYNVYGEFQSKELYRNTFSDEEKRERFLRWRIQFLEKSIRKLDFSPGGICTIVQVNDLRNSPGPAKRELRQATKQALQLLQDNYPEFVAKQIFINVPWWYLTVNKMISPFLTQRTRSKFVFAGPSKSAETLIRYIGAEQIPVKYGGLSKEGEFGTADAVTEVTVKPAAKHTVEFPVSEACALSWEVRVVGWEVRYGAEFVPSAEDSYTVIIQKARKVGAAEEPAVVHNSFNVGEPGKVVLTIHNPTSKKKKLLYRLKSKPSSSTH
ncbi:hypothetical protein Tsubulata_025256 [Turnera subulata]|uniref:CRAL-TRIO domain-containing protein n=1 Tax=Turnera subulata TaxID=218843 RepID=A0A9Q0G686_9ROSI|nr:hypothetical protein Tsubulata_025256 [Turnera subulata]